MTRYKLLFFPYLFYIITAFPCHILNQDDIVGTWLTLSTNSKVTIFKNGKYYYGKVSWLRNENDEHEKPKSDTKNPDTSLRNKHILGLLILKGFEYDEKNQEWINGEIYDPKNGKTYSCSMKLKDHNTLEVHGYIGISLIGRTEIWTRSE